MFVTVIFLRKSTALRTKAWIVSFLPSPHSPLSTPFLRSLRCEANPLGLNGGRSAVYP